MSWLKKLTSGLSKTSSRVTSSLSSLLGRSSIDAASLEDLEDALISADLGTTAAAAIAARVKSHKFDGDITAQALALALSDGLTERLESVAKQLEIDSAHQPHVVLLVGVNGSGKTTLLSAIFGDKDLVQGKVHLAGEPLFASQRRSSRRRHIAADLGYVRQKDIFIEELTVHETLTFTARLRMPS